MKKTAIVISILLLIAGCAGVPSQQPQSKDPAVKNAAETEETADESERDFKTLEDRFSYAYGLDLAEKLKAQDIKFNVALMAAAMQAVFDGSEKKMSPEETIATINIFRQVHQKEREEKRAIAAEKNKKEGEAFLKENAKKEGVVVTKSGLQYKVITPGKGKYKPTVEDEVKVHYRARFIDGKEFDNTYKRDKPFSVNAKMLIQGWAEALQLMTEGAKWELYIPANLAYGEKGSDPWIEPNAVLIFEVELLEIEKRKQGKQKQSNPK